MANRGARRHRPDASNDGQERRAIEFIETADCQLVVGTAAGRLDAASSDEHASDIAADLAAARTAEERKQLLRIALRTVGFDWLCYCRLTRLGEIVNRARYFNLCSPPGWAQRYVDQRYFDLDPRMAFACRHDGPLVWNHASLASALDAGANARTREFIADVDASGLRCGIAFGLVDPASLEHSVIMFSSIAHDSEWINDRVIGQAYALGLGVHAFLAERLSAASARKPTLSDLQRRILNFTASGLSDREIAEQLNMSRSNVDYHMRQIRKKYGVLNRVQLAFLAGRLFVV